MEKSTKIAADRFNNLSLAAATFFLLLTVLGLIVAVGQMGVDGLLHGM